MEVSEIIKKVRKIELKTRNISKHIFSGQYQSAFKGRGMSFSEVREYAYGDDIRHIDWNVTARTSFPHVKVYEEEREMTMMFLIDCSPSAHWGSNQSFKIDFITELIAVLAFSANQNNDKIGAIMFTDKIEYYIPPAKGKKHILRLIREMVNFKPSKVGTNIDLALRYFYNIQKKSCTCFLVSDFIDNNFDESIKIVSKRHDLIAVHVYDKAEVQLPELGVIHIKDKETGKKYLLDTSSKKYREIFRDYFVEKKSSLEKISNKLSMDLIHFDADEDYIKILMEFFKKRKS